MLIFKHFLMYLIRNLINLNTSHVDIQVFQRTLMYLNGLYLNTSHVDIQAIQEVTGTIANFDLNTSHVDIQGS